MTIVELNQRAAENRGNAFARPPALTDRSPPHPRVEADRGAQGPCRPRSHLSVPVVSRRASRSRSLRVIQIETATLRRPRPRKTSSSSQFRRHA